jgi:hypothetical protein
MERFAAGTMGAAPTALSWNVRRLNVEAFDTLDQVILDSSTYRFTLPAGKYYCEASGPARDVDHHKLRLRNVTNNTTLILGRSHYNGTSSSIFDAVLAGTFTLTSSVSIELQHYTQSAPSSAYLGDPTGTAASIGESYEIYATLHCYSYD